MSNHETNALSSAATLANEARRALSTLQSLLGSVASTFGAERACLISPEERANPLIIASSADGDVLREQAYTPLAKDVAVDVRYREHLLARMVVVAPPGEVDRARLDGFALAAGYILHNAGELSQLGSALAESTLLQELGLQFGQATELEDLLGTLVRNIRQLLGADYASIATLEPDGTTRWHAMDGYRTDTYKHVVFPPGRGTAARAINARKPLTFEGIGTDGDLPAEESPIHLAEGGTSALAAPLMRGGRALGALIIGSRHPRRWKEGEIRIASVLANSAALAIEQGRLNMAERAQRAFLSKLLDNLPGYLIVLEPPDFRIALINNAAQSRLPEPFRSGESPIGRPVDEVSNRRGPQADALLGMMRRVAETGQPIRFEQFESETAAGSKTWWNWTMVPVEEANAEGKRLVMLIAHEITDVVMARHDAQEAARDAYSRAEELEAVINQMADGVTLYDAAGRITKINSAGQRLLGRGLSTAVPVTEYPQRYGLHTLAGELFEPDQLPYKRALRGETVISENMMFKRPDGSDIIISISSAPVRDASGNVTGAVSVFHDVTQEKLTERLKDEFLSVVSHELRTPLSAIIGYSDLMMRGVHGGFNERQARALNAVRANADRLLRLINDLLDVSRLEAGTIRVDAKPVDVGEVLSRTIAQTRVLAANAGVTLDNRIVPGELPSVMADDAKLQQIIENLLTNAVKFTPAGGTVSFTAHMSPYDAADEHLQAHETERVARPAAARSVIVTVSDTGAGLEQEQLTRIWDRFYQVDSSVKRRAGGAGLGLAIVRNLVDLHGGQVWAESAGVNRGSTFRFSLPLAPAGEQVPRVPVTARSRPEETEDSDSARRRSGGMVLVAEDDEDQREIICDMLELEGYKVVVATDGDEALQLARRIKPTAIALDVILPRSDGWQVLHMLKSNPETRNIPVLIISVVDQQEFGKSLGADEYLIKPLDPMALRASVRRLAGLDQHRRADESTEPAH